MEKILTLLKGYLEYLKDIKRYSDNTIKAYRQDIIQFAEFSDLALRQIDHNIIRDFISSIYLMSQNKSSIARKIYVLKSFFHYLLENGMILHNPMDYISVPKIDKNLPDILTEKEINTFLDRLPQHTILEKRNKAIFELLYATGLRISELTALKITDINLSKRILRTLGKGKKERMVPFSNSSRNYLQNYLQETQKKFKNNNEYIFLNSRGGRISERSIERILKKTYKELMESNKNVYPHLFRHSFATHLLQRGANLRIIQELLGHSSLSTTQKYTNLNYSDLLNIYTKFHPRA
jgi:integrase/recombinase XerD